MDNEKIMCYITYAVPSDRMMDFFPVPMPQRIQTSEEFVPQWFNNGGFPEDDIE